MTTAFHVRPYRKFINIKSNLRKRNFIERIKDPIFLKTVLPLETMLEPQSDLKEKDNPNILKIDNFWIEVLLLFFCCCFFVVFCYV